MAGRSCEELLEVLSSFLDKKSLDCLENNHKASFKLDKFIKDLVAIICSSLPTNSCPTSKTIKESKIIKSFVAHIPELFACSAFFEVLKKYFEESANDSNGTERCLKLCTVVDELMKNCSLKWLFQVSEKEDESLEITHLEKGKNEIVEFLLSFMKQVDLMSLNMEELKNHSKSKLFPEILQICQSFLQRFLENTEEISQQITKNLQRSILRKIACDMVLVPLQYSEKCFWSSTNTRKAASDFLDFFLEMCNCFDLETLLSGLDAKGGKYENEAMIFGNGLLGSILQSIKCYTSKEKLVELPVVMHILVYSVKKVKHPFLGQHIPMLLPPLLLLVDDFRVHNRITGIKALEHVIENTNATELCWYGRAEVIYEALHHCIYTNEPDVMRVLQHCLLKILKVTEPSPKKPIAGRKMNKCDQNFQVFLTSMEFESKIAMRRAFSSHLVCYIDHMGITVLRHMKRLSRVVFGYLEVSDVETEEWRLSMLDVLKAIILNAWPRIPVHADNILKSLLKLVVDISFSNSISMEVKQAISVKIGECVSLLLCCCGEPVKTELEQLVATGLGHKDTEELIFKALQCYKTE